MTKKNSINYGITSRSIQTRYKTKKSISYSYEIIQEIQDNPENIWKTELYLKEFIRVNKLKYNPFKPFAGSETECYVV